MCVCVCVCVGGMPGFYHSQPLLSKVTSCRLLPSPQGKFSCRSAHVLYAITCTACYAVCIGETGCLLRERMNGYRYSLKHKQDMPVAEHFQKKDHKMAVRVFQGAREDVTMRRKLEKKWIAQLKADDRFQVINRNEGADIPSLLGKTLCTHLTLTNDTPAFPPIYFSHLLYMYMFYFFMLYPLYTCPSASSSL